MIFLFKKYLWYYNHIKINFIKMENSRAKIELEKMLKGELYDATIKELHDDIFKCKELCFDYNNLKQSETEKKK